MDLIQSVRGCIRGVKASASLKPRLANVPPRRCARYPRCKSLGLIEAPNHHLLRVQKWVGIRGVKASASLKPFRCRSFCLWRGSIRGVKASASLKRRSGDTVEPVCRGYPRCKSLGLIEASTSSRRSVGCRLYPRCKSLGLIEALRADTSRGEQWAVSEV